MSRARDVGNLGRSLYVDSDNFVGVGSLTPDRKFDVGTGDLIVGAAITLGGLSGIISATAYHGDGSSLEGVASAGLGTPINDDSVHGLQVIYYTNKTLEVTDDITVTVPDTSNVAYTQYTEVAVADTKDFIVAEGDEFIPDILGIGTTGPGSPLTGTGGRIRVNTITAREATGAPDFPNGFTVNTGVATFTAGINVTAGVATFAGNVSVGGTITYDDVTNVDSIGIVTAGKGFRATTGGLIVTAGVSTFGADLVGKDGVQGIIVGTGLSVAGVVTATSFNGDVGIVTSNATRAQIGAAVTFYPGRTDFNGLLVEAGNVTTGQLKDNTNINLQAGMVHTFIPSSGGETADSTPNLRYSATTSLNDSMSIGDTLTVTLITVSAGAYESQQLTIDGSAQTEEWLGGSAPTGSGSGYDVYTYTIVKTADATFLVLANMSNFA